MVVILVLGFNLAVIVWVREDRQRKIAIAVADSDRQTTTFLILHGPDPAVRQRVPVADLNWEGANFKTDDGWVDRQKLSVVEDGRRQVLIDLAVTGDVDRRGLKPIVIEDRGAELNGVFIDRLVAEYRKKKWDYQVKRTGKERSRDAEGAPK